MAGAFLLEIRMPKQKPEPPPEVPKMTVEPTEGGSHIVQPSEQVKEQSENVEE